MFVKQIRCALACATTPVARFSTFLRGTALPLSVRLGRVMAAAVVFAAPAMVTPAHGAGFSISDPQGACASWSWDSGTSTLTCVAAGAPAPGAPAQCSLNANPTSLPAGGGAVTLTAACASGGAPTQYIWTGGSIGGTNSSNTQQTNITSSTTFSVRPGNSSGNGNLAQATVSVASAGGGGGGGGGAGGAIKCDGYSSTIVMNLTYVADGIQRVQTSNGMSTSDILVATFTTPATIKGGYGQNGTLGITDNAQNSAGFIASLSETPCTFTSNIQGGLLSASWDFNSYKLKPLTTYFLNIKGDSPLSVKVLGR